MAAERRTFAFGFKRARKAAGYTQKSFAEHFGISFETVKKWEQGSSVPEMATIERLCEEFHCDFDYLLDRMEDRTHDDKFITEATGLDEDSIGLLGILKENRIVNLLLNHLIHDGKLLEAMVAFYAADFEKNAHCPPYNEFTDTETAKIDTRIFTLQAHDALAVDREKFKRLIASSDSDVEMMIFEYMRRSYSVDSVFNLLYHASDGKDWEKRFSHYSYHADIHSWDCIIQVEPGEWWRVDNVSQENDG